MYEIELQITVESVDVMKISSFQLFVLLVVVVFIVVCLFVAHIFTYHKFLCLLKGNKKKKGTKLSIIYMICLCEAIAMAKNAVYVPDQWHEERCLLLDCRTENDGLFS